MSNHAIPTRTHARLREDTMRYGIKYGGTIYVGQPEALVRRLKREVGEYRERGEPVPGGWARLVEPVNEAVLDTLRGCYEVCEIESR